MSDKFKSFSGVDIKNLETLLNRNNTYKIVDADLTNRSAMTVVMQYNEGVTCEFKVLDRLNQDNIAGEINKHDDFEFFDSNLDKQGNAIVILQKGAGGGGSSGSGMFLGYVTNGGSFPTTRTGGAALVAGDYVAPASTSTFPFTIGAVTFTSAKDTAVFQEGTTWIRKAGVFQNTEETPVKVKSTESLSGNSNNQKEINIEVVNAIKQYEYTISTAATMWHAEHNLDKYPAVVCLDGSNNTIIGAIQYVNKNTLNVYFANAESGKMILN